MLATARTVHYVEGEALAAALAEHPDGARVRELLLERLGERLLKVRKQR